MSNGWTPERRERQAVAIRCWKPWRFSTGPGTADGKRRSSRNRYERRQRLRCGASTKTPDRRARRSCRTFPFAQCRRSSDTEVRMRAGLSFRRSFSATGGGATLEIAGWGHNAGTNPAFRAKNRGVRLLRRRVPVSPAFCSTQNTTWAEGRVPCNCAPSASGFDALALLTL